MPIHNNDNFLYFLSLLAYPPAKKNHTSIIQQTQSLTYQTLFKKKETNNIFEESGCVKIKETRDA